MSIEKVITIGLSANELSKKIKGNDEVSAGRTAVATGTGAALGGLAAGSIVVGATAIGVATAAPIAVPLAVGGGIIAAIASLFD
jgi:hypothetical protein